MSRIGSPRTWSAVARQSRLAVPAAATAALCFSAGGFFAGTTAIAAIAALVALLLRITLARHPWEGWSAGLAVGAGALALFAVWTLVSSHWSGAPGRALLEFDRTLLYLAAFVVSGLFAARAGDLAVVVRWTAAAACGVCIVALATRLASGTFPTDRPPSHTRLEFPLTYWNGLGALAAVGLVLALHVTSSIRQPAVARVLAAAAVPAVALCLYFTFSRGGSIAAVFGVAVYLVLCYAAFVAAGGALLLHAGIDWDWELPALFVWFFGASGVVLASRRGASDASPPRLTRVVAGLACLGLVVTPVLVLQSQDALDRSFRAFQRGDCPTAIDAALDGIDALPARAEPFEILGYCDARAHRNDLAMRAMRSARARDPQGWEYAYGLAVTQALAGEDPTAAAAAAHRLNPLEAKAQHLQDALSAHSRAKRARAAGRAPIPFD